MSKILVRNFSESEHKGVKEAAKTRGTSVQRLAKNGILREAGLKTEEIARLVKRRAVKKGRALERPKLPTLAKALMEPQFRDPKKKRL